MSERKEYYSLPLEDCLERINECLEIRKVLKSHIKDNVDDDKAWSSDLMTLLCEYYSINSRYAELMNDLILTPPSVEEGSDDEIITVDAAKYSILTAYSKLMLVDEMELKYKYRVHLFIH